MSTTRFKAQTKQLKDRYESIVQNEGTISKSVSLKHFEKLFEKYEDNYYKLIDETTNIDLVSQYENDFATINNYLILLTKYYDDDTVNESFHHNRNTSNKSEPNIRLPEINLPTFSGKINEFPSFFSLFNSVINNRKDLPNVQKLFYLRSCLINESLQLISHLPLQAESYDVAINLLKNRYDNKQIRSDFYLNVIFTLPVILENLAGLRENFYNPLMETYEALKLLDLPIDQWSFILVHILLKKLPNKIQMMYNQRYAKDPNILPTFSQLVELLDEQCRLIQTSSYVQSFNQSKAEYSYKKYNFNKSYNKFKPLRTVNMLTAPSVQLCDFCLLPHTIYKCFKFRGLSIKDRNEWIRNTNKCKKCLRSHNDKGCYAKYNCFKCKGSNHNTLICLKNQHNNNYSNNKINSKSYTNYKQASTNSNNMSSQNNNCDVVMKTTKGEPHLYYQEPSFRKRRLSKSNSDKTSKVIKPQSDFIQRDSSPMNVCERDSNLIDNKSQY